MARYAYEQSSRLCHHLPQSGYLNVVIETGNDKEMTDLSIDGMEDTSSWQINRAARKTRTRGSRERLVTKLLSKTTAVVYDILLAFTLGKRN